MAEEDLADKVQRLSEENARMKATLDEIERAIAPFLENHAPSQQRKFEDQLLHDVRNILNELGLLRALMPDDEPENGPMQ